MAPKYRDVVLPTVLSGVRSDDELVRASSLANLAEVCRLLRYSLASHVHEVRLNFALTSGRAALSLCSRTRQRRPARSSCQSHYA